MIFVGLGCPRQEIFAYELGDRLQMPVFAVRCGFPFPCRDPFAGTQMDARQWFGMAISTGFRASSIVEEVCSSETCIPFFARLAGDRVRKVDPNKTTEPRVLHRYG